MPSSRRRFVSSVPTLLGGAAVLAACSSTADPEGYDAVTAQTWRTAELAEPADISAAALRLELVRFATLAPSSHNTQCWQFALEDHAITLLPDLARRCPAVDPDDHHVFVPLGCAAENLSQAALAHGLHAEADFDAARNALRIALTPTARQVSPSFQAITPTPPSPTARSA